MVASFKTWSAFQVRIGCPELFVTREGYENFLAVVPKIEAVFPNYGATVSETAMQEAVEAEDIWAHNAQAVAKSGMSEADLLKLFGIIMENAW